MYLKRNAKIPDTRHGQAVTVMMKYIINRMERVVVLDPEIVTTGDTVLNLLT